MSVEKFLDLSTGHLPVEDRDRLDLLKHRQLPIRVFYNDDYGWRIWLPGGDMLDSAIEALSEVYGFTEALGKVLRHTHSLGCWMVNLDRDAERIDELEYWDE